MLSQACARAISIIMVFPSAHAWACVYIVKKKILWACNLHLLSYFKLNRHALHLSVGRAVGAAA